MAHSHFDDHQTSPATSHWSVIQRALEPLAIVALVAVAYFVAGKLGLALASPNLSVSVVWPATGIAIAFLMLLGSRVVPGVLVGAFLVNVTTTGRMLSSASIAAGNALEAIVAVQLIERYAHGLRAFERTADAFRFVLAVAAAAAVGATVGVSSLLAERLASAEIAPALALRWWIGDATGGMLIAPLILAWRLERAAPWTRRAGVEFALLMGTTVSTALLIFGGFTVVSTAGYPLAWAVVPMVLWGATRFGQRGTSSAIFAVTCVAVVGTLRGFGPFGHLPHDEGLPILQSFIAELAAVALPVAAGMTERLSAEAKLREERSELEQTVASRTASLSKAIEAVRDEIRQHTETERRLSESESMLREAQSAGRIGSWGWDIASNAVRWSDELHRLVGRTPDGHVRTYEDFLSCVHPDDREMVDRTVRDSYTSCAPFGLDHRVVLPDGSVRWMQSRGKVVAGADGHALRMVGTASDITEQRTAERKLRGVLDAGPDAIVLAELSGTIVYANEYASRLFQYLPGQLQGRSIECVVPGALASMRNADAGSESENVAVQRLELRGHRSDGQEFPVEVTIGPLATTEGALVSVSIRDVSERHKKDAELRKSLREKDVLMKEIHHRVKNNLQITTSLLNLQAARLQDTASRDALAESADRVRSMALVHETLHEARDLGQIHFGEYARKVVEGLVHSYAAEPGNVTLRFAIEEVSLDIDNAIHCGLLLNELVSNSLKHAFVGRDHGEVAVSMRSDSLGRLVLEVRDDGVGFPRDLDFRKTRSLGMQLVSILAAQLGAELSLERDNGTSFRVTFAPAPKDRVHSERERPAPSTA